MPQGLTLFRDPVCLHKNDQVQGNILSFLNVCLEHFQLQFDSLYLQEGNQKHCDPFLLLQPDTEIRHNGSQYELIWIVQLSLNECHKVCYM